MTTETAPAPPCMLFAAGRGTRLRPLTDQTPKPLLQIGGRALLDRQLDQLGAAGVTQVVVNASHLGEQVGAHLEARTSHSPRVALSREDQPLETGGGLLAARSHFRTSFVWLLNGDIAAELPLAEFPRSLPPQDDLHLLLVPTPEHREQGDFNYADGRVTGRGNDYVYGCLALLRLSAFDRYVAEQRTLGAFADPPAFSLQGLLFDRVAAGRVGATLFPGPWFDIGSAAQLEAADVWARSSASA